MRIGTSVTEPFRRHPATLAQAFVTVDHLTKGRAILGVGNGERENTEPYGIPFTKRMARLEEALTIVRRLWESGGEPVDFDGDIWKLRRALFATPLYGGKPPPIWVAAHAPKMLALAGRFGDGWYPTKKMSATEYGDGLRRIAAGAAAAGRSMAGFEPAMQIQLALGEDRGSVLRQLASVPAVSALAMALAGPLWTRHGLKHPLGETFEGFPELVPESLTAEQIEAARRQVTPELIGDGVHAGNVGEVIDEIRPFLVAGLRHLVIWNVGPLAAGASLTGLVQLWVLVRRLKKLRVEMDQVKRQ
jgi:phthiodiolone/phenolphthiodiolone dimycocerosates ketoreductase